MMTFLLGALVGAAAIVVVVVGYVGWVCWSVLSDGGPIG